jgi:hypothetical protein
LAGSSAEEQLQSLVTGTNDIARSRGEQHRDSGGRMAHEMGPTMKGTLSGFFSSLRRGQGYGVVPIQCATLRGT